MEHSNKNILSAHFGHDACIGYYANGKYHNIQIEKVNGVRYSKLLSNPIEKVGNKTVTLLQHIEDLIGDIEFDEILVPIMTYYRWDVKAESEKGVINSFLKRFSGPNTKTVTSCTHHEAHAALGLYSSPFDKAIIVTTDGGGDNEFFTISIGDKETGITQLASHQVNLGALYLMGAALSGDIKSATPMAMPGKAMGLVARGKNVLPHLFRLMKLQGQSQLVPYAAELYHREYMNTNDRAYSSVKHLWPKVEFENFLLELGMSPGGPLKLQEGQMSWDVCLTNQKVFEQLFDNFTSDLIEQYDLPIIISGGCALNVLNNERIKKKYNREVFIPSAPDDSGLAVGKILERVRPQKQVDTHNICPSMLDHTRLDYFKSTREHKIVTNQDIAKLLNDGKIIGYMQGPSESGPRALGFRSILCDPSYPKMKDILNDKVKHREWFRPFAPACLKKHASKYFDSPSYNNLEFMSFALDVKENAKEKIPAVVHEDNTARLQTVTYKSNPYFYKLLKEFEKETGKHVLLNTSLNSWGDPISNLIEYSLEILDKTEMDYLVVDDVLFS